MNDLLAHMSHRQQLAKRSQLSLSSYVLELRRGIQALEAVPPGRAAEILDVSRRSVYRKIENGELESIIRKGKKWVTVRSIIRYIKDNYSSTPQFNILEALETRSTF